jgi:hypothetical protein
VTDDFSRPRPRKAVGPDRPTYFDAGDVDRVMALLLALVSEVASIRERLDTHERVSVAGVPPTGETVEAYQPDAAAEAEREAWRDGYIRRLFRVITEDVEALTATREVRGGEVP